MVPVKEEAILARNKGSQNLNRSVLSKCCSCLSKKAPASDQRGALKAKPTPKRQQSTHAHFLKSSKHEFYDDCVDMDFPVKPAQNRQARSVSRNVVDHSGLDFSIEKQKLRNLKYAKAKGADADELSYAEIKKERRRHKAELVQRQAVKEKAK